jgi:hypothetical protein
LVGGNRGQRESRAQSGGATLARRLQHKRQQLFVGRAAECAQFRRLLDSLHARVLYIHGQGGVGKTTLLHQLLHVCREAGVTAARIDAGQLAATPEAILSAVAEVVDVPIGQTADLSSLGRWVLMIDTFEVLAPIESWFRESFLAALPSQVTVVVAGREAPSSAWRSDAGWESLLERLPLGELSAEESREYLGKRGVPKTEHEAVLAFTQGHALALSLVADSFSQAPRTRFLVERSPDVVRALVEQLVRGLSEPRQRAALEACAVARTTTEGLLAALLDQSDVHAVFDWLRALSFMQSDVVGLYPHDLARKALLADLAFRDPDRLRLLKERALTHQLKRSGTSASNWRLAAMDSLYSMFQLLEPSTRSVLKDRRVRGYLPEEATARDLPDLEALIARHEGRESAAIARHWFARQPQAVTVIRDGSDTPAGVIVILELEALTDEDRRRDPVVAGMSGHLAALARESPGRGASLVRWWMGRDEHHTMTPIQALCSSLVFQHRMSHPQLAYSYLLTSNAETYVALGHLGGYVRVPALDVTIGGRDYGMFAHDMRRTPVLEFVERFVQGHTTRAAPSPPALAEEPFADAARLALKQLADPARLADNPLIGARLVLARSPAESTASARGEILRTILLETVASLGSSARSRRLRAALEATFVDPVGTQEDAAEALDLPFSTYRRHLTEGVAAVVAQLWRAERSA